MTVVFGGFTGIGEQIVKDLRSRGSAHVPVFRGDVRSHWEVKKFLQETIQDQNGDPITHLVYSVGVNTLAWIKEMQGGELYDMLRMYDINVVGFVRVLSALHELQSTPVSVVAISSDAAYRPMRTSLAYCASKAALTMAVRVASRELSPQGWRINSVSPGKVADTPMTAYVDSTVPMLRGWTPEFAGEYERNSSPIGRALAKNEVSAVVLDVLFGPAGLTGEDISINGGR